MGPDERRAEHRPARNIVGREAERIEWDTLWAKRDTRREYGEDRMIGLAYIGSRLHCVIYADRGETRRIISLRKANSREVKRYAET